MTHKILAIVLNCNNFTFQVAAVLLGAISLFVIWWTFFVVDVVAASSGFIAEQYSVVDVATATLLLLEMDENNDDDDDGYRAIGRQHILRQDVLLSPPRRNDMIASPII